VASGLLRSDAPRKDGSILLAAGVTLPIVETRNIWLGGTLTRPFEGERAREVAKLQNCLASKLRELQDGSFQPGWNEIKNLDNAYDSPKFQSYLPASEPRPEK
jgi:hypothetical protein